MVLLGPVIGTFRPQALDTAAEQVLKMTSEGYVRQSFSMEGVPAAEYSCSVYPPRY